MPVVVSIACLLVDQNMDFFTTTEPPLTLDIDLYPYTFSFVHADPYNHTQDLARTYETMFYDPYLVRIICLFTSVVTHHFLSIMGK